MEEQLTCEWNELIREHFMRRARLERWRRHERATACFWLRVRLSGLGLYGAGLDAIVRSIVDIAETEYKASM